MPTNKRIKIAANAIFGGAAFSAFIGSITGTLGFSLGSDESIVGILYVSGFQVKNYCGGICEISFDASVSLHCFIIFLNGVLKIDEAFNNSADI